MDLTTILGALVVAAAGLVMGSGAWPYKLMRKFQFEHWWFVGMLVGLVVMPWTIVLLGCPDAFQALSSVPVSAIVLGNLFSLGWGVANVLCGLCYVRIGVALTGAILAGLGVSVGAIVPLVFKGSGLFRDAADLGSPAGIAVLAGVGVMLVGVVVASIAGFGRDRALQKSRAIGGGFLGGLIMTVVAGVLSSFMAFVFVYSQGPIVAQFSRVAPEQTIQVAIEGREELSGDRRVGGNGAIAIGSLGSVQVGGISAAAAAERIKERLAEHRLGGPPSVRVETGSIPATFAVFAVGLLAGALVNVGYAAYLLTRNQSWNVFAESGRELVLAIVIGVNFSLAVALMGKGMLLLGALGASIGFGIQQAMQMTGAQALGFVSGEWRGVEGKPRVQMYVAIAILIAAASILAYGNTLAKS
ncbi:MAG: L-rhamnose/proton symporter RhaT [Thermoguttaceae bacterium]|jgi:hypothetical protein